MRRHPRSTLFPYTTLFRSTDWRTNPDARRYGYTTCENPFHLWGGFSQYMYLPWNAVLHRLPDNVRYIDRKSTRLNSSHMSISYAVFCLKKKNPRHNRPTTG